MRQRDIISNVDSWGIVDRDRRDEKEVEYLRNKNDDKLYNSLLQYGNPEYEKLAREHKDKKK